MDQDNRSITCIVYNRDGQTIALLQRLTKCQPGHSAGKLQLAYPCTLYTEKLVKMLNPLRLPQNNSTSPPYLPQADLNVDNCYINIYIFKIQAEYFTFKTYLNEKSKFYTVFYFFFFPKLNAPPQRHLGSADCELRSAEAGHSWHHYVEAVLLPNFNLIRQNKATAANMKDLKKINPFNIK